MGKLRFIVVLLVLLCNAGGYCQQIRVTDSAYDQAQKAFSDLDAVLKQDNGRLWRHKMEGPVLLINPGTRVVLANMADKKGALVLQHNLYAGLFPENNNIANSAGEWNGRRWTMVKWPLNVTQSEIINVLVHESFHRIQPDVGFKYLAGSSCTHLDTREGRIWLKMEIEALKEAIRSEDPSPHIAHALMFRKYRQHLFPGSRANENALELNEGLAEYTGNILSGWNFEAFKGHDASQVDWFYDLNTFVRSFAYITLPLYGYFMQQSDASWNLKIKQKTDLTGFLLDHFHIGPAIPLSEEIMRTSKFYKADSIIAFEDARELKRLAQVKKYREMFLGDSVLIIKLVHMNIGFSPGNLVPLDSLGTVYPNLRITDTWGILKVDSCGALVTSDWQHVAVPAPKLVTDSLIGGRGWTLNLAPGWKLTMVHGKYTLYKP